MIVTLKQGYKEQQLNELIHWVEEQGLQTHICYGTYQTVIGLLGDTSCIDGDLIGRLDYVESVARIQEPFKNANRKFHPDDSFINVGGVLIGGGHFQVIAGPCSIESEEQICTVAQKVKAAGAAILRGGAFKPRTSPYAFQGMGIDGLKLLELAKKETGLPIVTEIMDLRMLEYFENVDMIQVGARNMQNFEMLKELGHIQKPILLKRGLANTLNEWLMSAEYIMAGGNENIVLCERGIRTFETYTRNTLDISAVPALKEMSHLPVITDPSHATGMYQLVQPLALASVAAGADGLMIEVHNHPEKALCDGPQSLTPEKFNGLMQQVHGLIKARKAYDA